MKIKYTEPPRWKPEIRLLLKKIVEIVDDYESQGYRMTLRQLYYQLVSRDVIPNEQRQYAKLSRILTEARMSGLVDWDFIEDRVRVPKYPNEFEGIRDAMETIVNVYRLDRWAKQGKYVEVLVEKDALSGVLEPITREYHVRLLVNRGYSSATAMHDLALRIGRQQKKKDCIILYLGDHDPSGNDMVRDIQNRLDIFGCNVDVQKIALTMEQIEESPSSFSTILSYSSLSRFFRMCFLRSFTRTSGGRASSSQDDSPCSATYPDARGSDILAGFGGGSNSEKMEKFAEDDE